MMQAATSTLGAEGIEAEKDRDFVTGDDPYLVFHTSARYGYKG